MKNFDLDQIKNRQIQEMPVDFYTKVQENVLEKTIGKNKTIALTSKTKFNWVYAAAASLAVIVSGTYFFQNEEIKQNVILSSAKSTTEQNQPELVLNESVAAKAADKIEEKFKNKSSVANTKEKIETNVQIPVLAKSEIIKPMKQSKTEDQIDVLLENFTPEEMASLAKNSDKDVYLDLYN